MSAQLVGIGLMLSITGLIVLVELATPSWDAWFREREEARENGE